MRKRTGPPRPNPHGIEGQAKKLKGTFIVNGIVRYRILQRPPHLSLLPRQLIHHLPPAHKRLAYASHSRFDAHVTRVIFLPVFRQFCRMALI
jgi:hypothetical protein